ncbi:MAG: replication-relaxation family protein [Dehalococcoidia bacterium]|nr:replication-relaxation family protein [Dehalococcoidia bacterium]
MTPDGGEIELARRAVHWLLRLPFLGTEEMSLLLGVDEGAAGRVLAHLDSLGWVEWVVPGSPELGRRRLFVLTEAALPGVAAALGATEGELAGSYPVGCRETLLRLARLETTVGLNCTFAELAAALSRDIEVDLADARSLPWAVRGTARRWPPEVEAYGCLRWGPWFAPFFVAWDRAGAPAIHRRKRVAGWYAFRDSNSANPWGGDGLPPVVLVCPGEREAQQWARSVLASADRRGCPPLSVVTARAGAVFADPLGPIWRRVDGIRGALLCERLRWVPQSAVEAGDPAPVCGDLEVGEISARGVPLREWVKAAAEGNEGLRSLSETERLASLSLATSADHKTLLEWLGHHPLLSADDLAAILRVSGQLAQRLLDSLARYSLVGSTDKALEDEAAPPRRYFLTDVGLKLLAARDGVPSRRYARHGIVAAAPGTGKKRKGDGRLQTLLRQFEHTVGVNGFFIRLIQGKDNNGRRLVRWLSASEASQKFTYGEVTHWLRPDGAGDVHFEGNVRRFYLEWDRGTVRLPLLVEKCRLYAAYYAYLARAGVPDSHRPSSLVVTNSPLREGILWRALDSALEEVSRPQARFLTSVAALIHRLGPFGVVWHGADGSARRRWP